ncbi:MAG: beta-glucosidase BglX [Bacteroidota bacterium]
MKNVPFVGILCVGLLIQACSTATDNREYDPVIEAKVDSVLALMTLEEKIGQLTLYTSDMDQTGAFLRSEYKEDIRSGEVGAIFNAYGAAYTRELQEMAVNETRLGIPLLFGYDVIHGHRTIFPMPLAEASSWDLDMMEQTARIAAREATAEGLHWTFAPMVDISREPRWGRIVEGGGEDSYLGALIGAAKVRGFQGDDLRDVHTMAATVKHFAAYGAAKAGRDYHTTDMSDRELREVYLPPFKAAIDAGAVSIMTSFNDLNGVPATANDYLFKDILREEWGFNGFVVTDYTAIMELLYHGIAKDPAHASELAIKAGIDMSMQDGFFQQNLAQLVEEQRISERLIDEATKNVLRIKFQLGLFDDPFRYSDPDRQEAEVMKDEHLEIAKEMAKRSVVLLKNDDQTLPLSKNIRTVAVIGPMADNQRDMIGSWSAAGDWSKSVSLLEGMKNKLPEVNFVYAKGAETTGDDKSGFREALRVARNADAVILALGENYWMSGEAASKVDISLPGVQEELALEVEKLGKPTIAVLMNGRPLTIGALDENMDALLEAWFLGTTTGDALADILFGDYNPSGKLTVTFPAHLGQVPIHYDMKNTGRPMNPDQKYTSKYIDAPNEPLYVFGYGLSYTTFDYGALSLSSNTMTTSERIDVRIEVRNTGQYGGEEIVQLYIQDKVGSVTRPVKELKGFEKVYLEPGESKEVLFTITNSDLEFYRKDMTYGSETGEFVVYVGGNSKDVQSVEFELVNLK